MIVCSQHGTPPLIFARRSAAFQPSRFAGADFQNQGTCPDVERAVVQSVSEKNAARHRERRFMRFAAAIVASTFMVMTSVSGRTEVVRISGDSGGEIGPYLKMFQAWRNAGNRVVIDGLCLSACTIILGVIPRTRICVTSRAKLGFHAAWRPDDHGRQVINKDATRVLMDIYPTNIRAWLVRRGGLSDRIKYLAGPELASMYPTCQ